MNPQIDVWNRMREVVALRFNSKSHSGIGWSGTGTGTVKLSEPTPGILIFDESGTWRQDGGSTLHFTNTFRWTALPHGIRLEQLRFGHDRPVFLFDMAVDVTGAWHELSPHPCRNDCYRASLRLEHEQIFMNWLVRGPERDEAIDYVYV